MQSKVMFVLFVVCIVGSALVGVSEGADCSPCGCYGTTSTPYGYIGCSSYNTCPSGTYLYCTNSAYGCTCPVCSGCSCYYANTAPYGYKVCQGNGGNCGHGKHYYCPGGPYCECPSY